MPDLHRLPFDNSYARLGRPFAWPVEPTPLHNPRAVSFNAAAAELIGLDATEADRDDWVRVFSGNAPLAGAEPVAMLYAGHQFGAWVPQLGDGRAILLGQVRGPAGRWDLHLKGSGPTPFSRGFDGRAVLRSTIREYLCGEAMHGLGIPTTRGLCIVGSDEPVRRERVETAATLVRLAPSHVRFGSFEVLYARRQHDQLRTLAEYVVAEHYPELERTPDRFAALLAAVVTRTAQLIARWQTVGWAHGVMNTDNMSILGITLDYGPFGFMDDYDPGYVPNHSDHTGRYAFDQQPGIGLWNVTRLATALSPLMEREQAVAALDGYEAAFLEEYAARVRAKLGLRESRDEDAELLASLLELLAASRVDYTTFWRTLGGFEQGEGAANEPLRDLFVDWAGWEAWADRYRARLRAEGSDDAERRGRMDAANPKYVLRTYLAEAAIRRAEDDGDFSEVDRLLAVLRRPFDDQPALARYAERPPDWGRRLVVSCSS